jgi:hypothetical protein
MTSQKGLDRSQLEKLDKEALISIILMLQQQVRELQRIVAAQAVEIQELRDQVAKNSRNQRRRISKALKVVWRQPVGRSRDDVGIWRELS